MLAVIHVKAPHSYYRARYYDSALGRFISEDPLSLSAGLNFYRYVDNRPTLFNDPFGLSKNTGKPADPNKNTIVCDGKGGIRVQLSRDYGLLPDLAKCVGDCVRQHEELHIMQALLSNPTVCIGAQDGIQVGYSNNIEQDRSEIAGYAREKQCLEEKKKRETCDQCKQMQQRHIDGAAKEISSWSWWLNFDTKKK